MSPLPIGPAPIYDDIGAFLPRISLTRSRVISIFVIFVLNDIRGHGILIENGINGDTILRQTLAECTYDRDCMENAYCRNQKTCVCMKDYLVDRNRTHVRCLKIATNIGDSCTEDVQCHMTFTVQAECRNNRCGCSPGSHFEAGRCYEFVGIGQVCQTSYNCYVEGSSSFCVDGYCSCPLQHHPNSHGTRCLKSALLGDDCTSDEECTAANSRCFDVCGCKVDYVLSMDGTRCLKAGNSIGDECEENSQCQEFLKNSRCGEDGKCRCNMDFRHRGSVCRRDFYARMLGKHCDAFNDCVEGPLDADFRMEMTRVDCINGICSCAKDYTLTEDGSDCIGFSEINYSTRPEASIFLAATFVFTIIALSS